MFLKADLLISTCIASTAPLGTKVSFLSALLVALYLRFLLFGYIANEQLLLQVQKKAILLLLLLLLLLAAAIVCFDDVVSVPEFKK
jgi:hypothetical protein